MKFDSSVIASIYYVPVVNFPVKQYVNKKKESYRVEPISSLYKCKETKNVKSWKVGGWYC